MGTKPDYLARNTAQLKRWPSGSAGVGRPDERPGVSGDVEQFAAPTLQSGDVLVMDSFASHKVAGVGAAIKTVGVSVFYLPPYSPDLNPIEQVFAKLKALLCGPATRTRDALWTTSGRLLNRFSSVAC